MVALVYAKYPSGEHRSTVVRRSQVIAHSVKDPADFTIVGISADIKRVREDSMKKIAIVTGASRGIGRERSTRQRFTVFTLSGRMEAAQVPELKELFDRDYRNIIPDLRGLTLAGRAAVRFVRAGRRRG